MTECDCWLISRSCTAAMTGIVSDAFPFKLPLNTQTHWFYQWQTPDWTLSTHSWLFKSLLQQASHLSLNPYWAPWCMSSNQTFSTWLNTAATAFSSTTSWSHSFFLSEWSFMPSSSPLLICSWPCCVSGLIMPHCLLLLTAPHPPAFSLTVTSQNTVTFDGCWKTADTERVLQPSAFVSWLSTLSLDLILHACLLWTTGAPCVNASLWSLILNKCNDNRLGLTGTTTHSDIMTIDQLTGSHDLVAASHWNIWLNPVTLRCTLQLKWLSCASLYGSFSVNGSWSDSTILHTGIPCKWLIDTQSNAQKTHSQHVFLSWLYYNVLLMSL